jgi:2'-5' RNA ligase
VDSFNVTFDRASSFAGKPGKLPFLLRGKAGVAVLKIFQGGVITALQRAGLAHRVGVFTPHVTLLYAARSVAVQPVAPVNWIVREFVLVHSELGKTRYMRIIRPRAM